MESQIEQSPDEEPSRLSSALSDLEVKQQKKQEHNTERVEKIFREATINPSGWGVPPEDEEWVTGVKNRIVRKASKDNPALSHMDLFLLLDHIMPNMIGYSTVCGARNTSAGGHKISTKSHPRRAVLPKGQKTKQTGHTKSTVSPAIPPVAPTASTDSQDKLRPAAIGMLRKFCTMEVNTRNLIIVIMNAYPKLSESDKDLLDSTLVKML